MTMIVDNFINGDFQISESYIDSINPATQKKLASIANSTNSDVDNAIKSARAAFPYWSSLSYQQRAVFVNKLADLIEERIDDFALLESQDQGKTLKQARDIEMPRVLTNFRFFAASPQYMHETSTEMTKERVINMKTRFPVGVAGIITPWNLPLYLLSFKLAPCIMYGNTCVCKPSEFTSLTAWKMCELIKLAGFPAGVINFIFGEGSTAGDALMKHPDIDLITFTGSTKTGQLIEKANAGKFKKLSLELGGKNAALVFNDANLEESVNCCIRSSFLNQGEVCLSTSRIFVQSEIYEQFVKAFVDKARELKVGDPLNSETYVGALISNVHMEKVLSYIKKCKGKLQCGYGKDDLCLPEEFKNGYFIQPTVFTNVDDNESIMTEEVFGPVTVITSFQTNEEVIEKVNSVEYGLCASIHSKDQSTSIEVAQKLKVGTVWINCWLIRDLRMPFGGCKMSGIGREGQEESREFFTELKTICFKY